MSASASPFPFVLADLPCNLCGAHEAFVVAERDRDGRPLRTVISARSGLVWTDPRPASEQIDAYYACLYRLSYKGRWQPRPKHVWRAGQVARDRYHRLAAHFGGVHRVLDVGASGGEFVYLLRRHGKEASGIEPNQAYVQWAREVLDVPMTAASWHNAELPAGAFDAVTFFHVVEHLEDPAGALARARLWLRPGGIAVVEVPNVEAVCGSPRGKFHFAHLYNFNGPALEMLGRKCGFEVAHREVSGDGGNLTAVFQKSNTVERLTGEIPGNCARVLSALAGHTMLRYGLSPRTWARPLRKVLRAANEMRAVQGGRASRALLDKAITG